MERAVIKSDSPKRKTCSSPVFASPMMYWKKDGLHGS